MTRILISEIITNSGTQSRVVIDEKTVEDYAERMNAGDSFPPVDVFHDGKSYYLADGFHRVMAASRNGNEDISVTVHKGTRKDAVWFSVGANKTNGLHRTVGDKRSSIILALKEFPDKSQQEIAEHVGCAQSYVASVKKDVITTDNVEPPATRKDSKGRVQPTTKPRRSIPLKYPPPEPVEDWPPADPPHIQTADEIIGGDTKQSLDEQQEQLPTVNLEKTLNDARLHDALSLWSGMTFAYQAEFLRLALTDKAIREAALKIAKQD